MASAKGGCSLVLACLLLAAVTPAALAEDNGVSPRKGDPDLVGDVIDEVGGFLKLLVGPPLTPPPPLNLPIPEPGSKPLAPAAPPPVALVPAAPPPPPPTEVLQPAPQSVAPPMAPATIQPAVLTPSPPPVMTPPPPTPTRPTRAVLVPQPLPVPEPPSACPRVAATATIEQAAKLPRCP